MPLTPAFRRDSGLWPPHNSRTTIEHDSAHAAKEWQPGREHLLYFVVFLSNKSRRKFAYEFLGVTMKKLLLAAALSLTAGSVSAATYVLGSGSDDLRMTTLASDHSPVSVSGYRDYAAGTEDVINRHGTGWGVGRSGPAGIFMAGNEALAFDFSSATKRLISFDLFAKGPEEETLDLYVDGVYRTTVTIPAGSGASSRFSTRFDVESGGYTGNVFAFVSTSPGDQGVSRGVRLSELSVEAVQAVPLPAGVLLLGSGLLLMAGKRRRKS